MSKKRKTKSMKIKSDYATLPNEFHLYIQTKYRQLVQEDKTKYKRSREKQKLKKELKESC